MTVNFPHAFVRNARLSGLLPEEVENGREEKIGISCNNAEIAVY